MSRPLVAMTPWRGNFPSYMHPITDLYTLDNCYLSGVEEAGGDTAIVHWAATTAGAERRMSHFDALVLTGGQDMDPSLYGAALDGSVAVLPDGDASDIAFVQAAISQGKPILGICRGQQVVNVALGGSLHQHIWGKSNDHPVRPETDDVTSDAEQFMANRHRVLLDPDSEIARLAGQTEIEVNSLHHQSIDQLGDGLKVVGRAPDGTIEAIEHETHPILCVQWHPERLRDDLSNSLFAWLVAAAS